MLHYTEICKWSFKHPGPYGGKKKNPTKKLEKQSTSRYISQIYIDIFFSIVSSQKKCVRVATIYSHFWRAHNNLTTVKWKQNKSLLHCSYRMMFFQLREFSSKYGSQEEEGEGAKEATFGQEQLPCSMRGWMRPCRQVRESPGTLIDWMMDSCCFWVSNKQKGLFFPGCTQLQLRLIGIMQEHQAKTIYP